MLDTESQALSMIAESILQEFPFFTGLGQLDEALLYNSITRGRTAIFTHDTQDCVPIALMKAVWELFLVSQSLHTGVPEWWWCRRKTVKCAYYV